MAGGLNTGIFGSNQRFLRRYCRRRLRPAPCGIIKSTGFLIRSPFLARGHPISVDNNHFFFQHYGLSDRDLEHYLAAALSAGGDYADLYFEYLSSTSLSVDESMVKSASQGISAGCGVRVISGERTGYAYTDDLSSSTHSARGADRGIDRQRSRQNAQRGISAKARRAVCIQ